MQSIFQIALPSLDSIIDFNPVVVTPVTTILEAINHTCASAVGCNSALVVDGGKVTGVITAQDIFQQVILSGVNLQQTLVQSVMQPISVYCNYGQDDLTTAVNLWLEHQLFVLPVVNVDDGCVVGCITTASISPYLSQLQATSANMHSLLDAVDDVLIVCDRHGQIIDVNDRTCDALGYSRDQLRDRYLDQIKLTESPEGVWECAFANVPILVNTDYLHQNGESVTLETQYKSIEINGSLCMLLRGRDIRQAQSTFAALYEVESCLRILAETAPAGICINNQDGKKTFLSNYWSDVTGVSDRYLLGDGWLDFIHPEDRKKCLNQLQQAISQHQAYELEYRLRHRDRQYYWYIHRGSPHFDIDGKFIGHVGACVEVQKHWENNQKIEDALFQQQNLLQAILDYSPTLIYAFDLNNNFILASKKTAKLLNVSYTEIIGKNLAELVPGEQYQSLLENNAKVARLGAPFKVEETAYNQGQEHTYISVKFPLKDSEGQVYAVCGISTNITERKEVEENLIRFHKAIETSGDGIAIADGKGKVIYLNPTFQFRMRHNLESINQGNNALAIYGKRKYARKVYHHILQGQPWNDEVVMQDSGEQCFDAEMRADIICDRNDNLIGFVAIFTEITEKRHMQQMIRLRDRALSVGTHGVTISNMKLPDTPLSYVNDSFERLTGFTDNEAIGRNCRFLQRFDRKQPALEGIKSAIRRNAIYTAVIRNYTKDGIMFANELTIAPVFDTEGDVTHYVGVQRDVTAQKQIEVALRVSRARLDYVMSSSPSILYSCQSFQDISISFVSNNILTILGFNPEQFLFDTEFWEKQIHPDDVEKAMSIRKQILSTDCDITLEYRVLNSRQEYIWIYDTLTILKDNCDRPLEIIGQWVDITERKNLEAELRWAIEREKELHDLKSRFVSMTSHEFRTPLSTILSSSELLEYYRHKWTEEKQVGHLQRIQGAVQHMTSLLNDVLLIGKAEAGKLEYHPQQLELIGYCHNLVENILIMTKSNERITFTFSPECIYANLDERLLEHILTNLLTNAVKYSPPETKVDFDVVATSNLIKFTIQDKGIGIPSEDIPHLFESFHRATNVGNIQGTGLGLAIVKQCVNLHHGEIDVQSQVGVGTTFTILLPLHDTT